jgi:hypothetical protein
MNIARAIVRASGTAPASIARVVIAESAFVGVAGVVAAECVIVWLGHRVLLVRAVRLRYCKARAGVGSTA